jgi:hypothetical protein
MDSQIVIKDWTALDSGLYRFFGADPSLGGFYADARLECRAARRASIQSTNYTGSLDRLAVSIAAFAENM